MDLFEFKKIAFKAVMYSKSLDKFFVSDSMEIDSGLACLFGFENEGVNKLDNLVLCSKKFVKEIKEDWQERDWCHIGNLQSLELKDKNGTELFDEDIIEYVEKYPYSRGKYIQRTIVRSSDYRLLDRIERCNGNLFTRIGNKYENPELLEVYSASNINGR